MKIRRVTKNYIEQYNKVILTQPLAHGVNMQQIYDKEGQRWRLSYTSSSVHHICPYDGVFRNCKDCGALEENFDDSFCSKKTQFVSTGALVERIKDCIAADLQVELTD